MANKALLLLLEIDLCKRLSEMLNETFEVVVHFRNAFHAQLRLHDPVFVLQIMPPGNDTLSSRVLHGHLSSTNDGGKIVNVVHCSRDSSPWRFGVIFTHPALSFYPISQSIRTIALR